ncbi:unnamed protein product, partial [Urochloa humidicola]
CSCGNAAASASGKRLWEGTVRDATRRRVPPHGPLILHFFWRDLIASTTTTAFLLLLFLAYLLHCKRTYGSFIFWRKRSYISPRVKAFLERYGSLHPKVYSYAEVKQMTKSLAYQLGEGGCGVVYRGRLP